MSNSLAQLHNLTTARGLLWIAGACEARIQMEHPLLQSQGPQAERPEGRRPLLYDLARSGDRLATQPHAMALSQGLAGGEVAFIDGALDEEP